LLVKLGLSTRFGLWFYRDQDTIALMFVAAFFV
jgi:hypothetical protein